MVRITTEKRTKSLKKPIYSRLAKSNKCITNKRTIYEKYDLLFWACIDGDGKRAQLVWRTHEA